MEEKPIGKEAHPTAHAAAGRGSPQLCPTRRPVQSGDLPVTEATPRTALEATSTVYNSRDTQCCLLQLENTKDSSPSRPLLSKQHLSPVLPISCGTQKTWQPATVKNLLHIKATPSFFFFTRFTELFIPTPTLQMPPVFTFLFSLHVFSCLKTICPISFVMWLTHPALFPFLWLFRPLAQLHPSWLVLQKGTLETSRSLPVPFDMVSPYAERK